MEDPSFRVEVETQTLANAELVVRHSSSFAPMPYLMKTMLGRCSGRGVGRVGQSGPFLPGNVPRWTSVELQGLTLTRVGDMKLTTGITLGQVLRALRVNLKHIKHGLQALA